MHPNVHTTLFITARYGRNLNIHPKCVDKEVVLYIHNGILLKHENELFVASWMELKGILLSEINQMKTNTV